nr:hypothetical protein [uncultured Methanobrevibacter sp.]
MYYYKFESIDFEEQYAFELMHWRKFSREELDLMVKKAIRIFIEQDFKISYVIPCHLDIGNLFLDDSLMETLIREFGFTKIDFESKVSYGGEALFSDDFRHRDGVNFREIFRDVKVPKCDSCIEDECLIDNQRF